MCRTFRIAEETTDDFVENKDSFTLEELREQIVVNGGVQRVAPSVTVKDYLEDLEEQKVIVYDFASMSYYRVEFLEAERLKYIASF